MQCEPAVPPVAFGPGRASIASPTTIVKDGDTYTATITWSSSNYDKMTVDGVDYAPVNDGGNSTFEIPVTLDEDIAVSAETVAMSTPHTIDYRSTSTHPP